MSPYDSTRGDELRRLEEHPGSPQQALAFFDTLPPARLEEMPGLWKGSGLKTGHAWDGLLEDFGWYGKRFDDTEHAHPLVFRGDRRLFCVNPSLMLLNLLTRTSHIVRTPPLLQAARRSLRLLRTSRPAARLRMTEYRGTACATMSYDALPINDHFRKVDESTLIGVMDMRGDSAPFFFVLRRNRPAPATL